MLENLLEYHQEPQDSAFVAQVMKRVQRQQRIRRLILASTAVTGSVFGTIGALTLAEPVARTIANISVGPVMIAAMGGVAFLAWLFQDEGAAWF